LTGIFVGRPFGIDYGKAHVLVADSWKQKAKGIPQGSFLLAYYENEEDVSEALLLRVIGPTKLPTDMEVISSMVEYYKDNLKTSGITGHSQDMNLVFRAVEFRYVYRDPKNQTKFGADVENLQCSYYVVIKPNGSVLEL
jgi:hypothetical protein